MQNNPVRVLNVLGTTKLGGAESRVMELSPLKGRRMLIQRVSPSRLIQLLESLPLPFVWERASIVVKGIDDVAVRFSKCCSPVPGDEIVGFVTRGRGVSIHRTDCINVLSLSDIERSRLIDAEWAHDEISESGEKYLTSIAIYAQNRSGLLTDVSKVLTEKNINIIAMNTRTSKQGVATMDMSFEIRSRQELTTIIDKIRMIENVIDIERTTG